MNSASTLRSVRPEPALRWASRRGQALSFNAQSRLFNEISATLPRIEVYPCNGPGDSVSLRGKYDRVRPRAAVDAPELTMPEPRPAKAPRGEAVDENNISQSEPMLDRRRRARAGDPALGPGSRAEDGGNARGESMSIRQPELEGREAAAILAHAQPHNEAAGPVVENEIPDRYLEDFAPGMVFEFGDYLMTEDEIVAFARQYDPQPFHTERHPPAGAAHPTLIASGWHTGAATMRMMVDHFISWKCSLPSPGHDGMRFVIPVRPGDRLRVRLTVISVRPSASKPDRGIVMLDLVTLNQASQVVLTMRVPHFVRRRAAES